jgi:hypothetical protein
MTNVEANLEKLDSAVGELEQFIADLKPEDLSDDEAVELFLEFAELERIFADLGARAQRRLDELERSSESPT